MVACADQLVQSGLLQTQILQEHGLFIIVQLGDLLLDLGADHKDLAAILVCILADSLHMRIGSAVVGQIFLAYICRKDHRLVGQQIVA